MLGLYEMLFGVTGIKVCYVHVCRVNNTK